MRERFRNNFDQAARTKMRSICDQYGKWPMRLALYGPLLIVPPLFQLTDVQRWVFYAGVFASGMGAIGAEDVLKALAERRVLRHPSRLVQTWQVAIYAASMTATSGVVAAIPDQKADGKPAAPVPVVQTLPNNPDPLQGQQVRVAQHRAQP